MIFQPPRRSYTVDDSEFISPPSNPGYNVAARHFHNPKARYTLLYSHGNATDIGRIFPMMEAFRDQGFSVLCYDYPGYGLSTGVPTEKGAYMAADAAYAHLTDTLKIPENQIIIIGHSVGSGPATYLAETHDAAGLILISPLVSAYRVVTKYPLIPFDKFKNLSRIDEIGMPLLIIHGTRDEVIPIWHGMKLFKKAHKPKYFLRLNGLGHNNLFQFAENAILKHISEFTKSLEPKPPTD